MNIQSSELSRFKNFENTMGSVNSNANKKSNCI